MNTPNKLTILRVLLIPIFMFFLLSNLKYGTYYAILVFILASITDNLDGYLARKNNQVTTFGKLMDPLADKLLTISALICFLEINARFVNAWVVMVIVARELIVTGIRLIALGDSKVIAASYWGKAKTASQFVTITAIMIDIIYPLSIVGVNFTFWFITITVILTVLSGLDYIRKNWFLLKFK